MPTSWKRWTVLLLLGLMAAMLSGCGEMMVLDPKGPIASQQRDLIVIATVLCSVIIVPVLFLAGFIAYRYRDKPGNKAAFTPKWEHSTKLEVTWWSIPIVVILVLAVITVRYTHATEPSKPLESEAKTMVIQVTSLDWKWLFKYPEQDIATVNYVQFPVDVPVRFELTADAPMNSFWIPQLGGQMYTMSGMAMILHLQGDEIGVYHGSGANFSGREFGSMKFDVNVSSQADFDAWVAKIKSDSPALTLDGYNQLAKPSVENVQSFSSFPEGLFNKIVHKYAASHQHGAKTESSNAPKTEGTSGEALPGSQGTGDEAVESHDHAGN